MKKSLLLASLMIAALSSAAVAANPQAAGSAQDKDKPTFASVYDHTLSNVEKEVVEAAEAMPEDKFNFAPSGPGDFKGVRTFAMQVKHIAVANYAFGSAILGEKSPAPMGGPNGPDNITSRADILNYLKDSFAYAHKAIATINESNILTPTKGPFGDRPTTRLAMATSVVSHPFDHYGQMVVYLRMNNIIPPASRK
jgi:uncharacterized damage-inducible protein DinB